MVVGKKDIKLHPRRNFKNILGKPMKQIFLGHSSLPLVFSFTFIDERSTSGREGVSPIRSCHLLDSYLNIKIP